MQTNQKLFSSVTCLILVSWLLVLQYLLYKRKNKFPYTNIYPLWQFIYISAIIINHLLAFLYYMLSTDFIAIESPTLGEINSIIFLVNNGFVHYFFLLPNLTRSYFYLQALKHHYYHITTKNLSASYQREIEENYETVFTIKREAFQVKLVLMPIAAILVLLVLLSIPDYTRCLLINIVTRNLTWIDICVSENEFSEYTIMLLSCAGLVLLYLEVFLFSTLVVLLHKFPIKCDIFLIKPELVGICSIWLAAHFLQTLTDIFFSLDGLVTDEYIYYASSVEHLLYALLYTVLMYKRQKIQDSDVLRIFYDFDKFMNNHISFNFFRGFLQRKFKDDVRFLQIWLDLNIFKRASAKALRCKDVQAHEQLEAMALEIYEEYFSRYITPNGKNGNSEVIFKESKDFSTEYVGSKGSDISESPFCEQSVNYNYARSKGTRTRGRHYSEFPTELREKLEDFAQYSFSKSVCNLNEVFDEAELYISNRLYDRYLYLCRDKEENSKLEMLVYYMDFCDLEA